MCTLKSSYENTVSCLLDLLTVNLSDSDVLFSIGVELCRR